MATASGSQFGLPICRFVGSPLSRRLSSVLFALEDGKRFVSQAASYAVAKGKKTAALCVLDFSSKSQPPRDPSQLVGLQTLENGIQVCLLVIQGNLPEPRALSRGSAHQSVPNTYRNSASGREHRFAGE